jgi:sec-independent protein translocase protein TatA
MPGFIGFWELLALAAVLLLLFGPKRLPEIGRSMGKGLREFKDSIAGPMDDAGSDAVDATTDVVTPLPSQRMQAPERHRKHG